MALTNKKTILSIIDRGDWSIDQLSTPIIEKIKRDKHFIKSNFKINNNNLKTYASSYYCNICVPLDETFYLPETNLIFNTIISNKILKDTKIVSFTDNEKDNIFQAINMINKYNKGLNHFLTNLSFIKMDTNEFNSASSAHLIGSIILTNKIEYEKDVNLTKSLIHELAHQELNLINFFDNLINDEFTSQYTFSPYQKCNRPPIGRLHSLWALFRMVQYLKSIGLPCCNQIELIDQTIQTFEKNILTSFAEQLILKMRVYIEKNN